jgi:zinc/manganese transport system substrate-binding protein
MNKLVPGIACLLLLSCSPSMAARVVSCEPDWAHLSQEISGYKVDVSGLVAEGQDPHHIRLTPNSLALLQQADLLVCNDIDHDRRLKVFIRKSGNAALQPGQVGYLDVRRYIEAQSPQGQSRLMGWQHIERDPRNILLVAEALTERLTKIDPSNSRYYRERHENFSMKWKAAMRAWEKRAAPLNGIAVVVQRNSCEYLCRWLGIRELATVEPTQGGTVNLRQMHKVMGALDTHPARMIIAGPYHSSPAISWLAEKTKLPVVTLPTTPGDMPGAKALYAIFDEVIAGMLAATS